MFNSYMSHYVIVNLTNSEIEKEIKLIRVLLLDHTTINQVGIKNNLTHSLIAIVTGDSTEDGDIGTTGHHPEIT